VNGSLDGRLVASVAIVGGGALLFLILFGVWLVRHPESLAEHRMRSWSRYGQFLLSTLLIVMVCLLMVARTISSESGLAVLAAIAGFVAGRTVRPRSRKGRRVHRPADRDRPEPIRPIVTAMAPPTLAHDFGTTEASPPPLREIEPIVTAHYPRNRRGSP
jgi:Ca2+/Na+ antiporter